MDHFLFHAEHAAAAAAVGGGGSPLYDIAPEHLVALVAVAALPAMAWLVGRLASAGRPWAVALRDGHGRLAPVNRLVVWLLAVSAAVHLGLALAHGGPELRLLFVADAMALGFVARCVVISGRWRAWAVTVLVASIAAYWVANLAGEPPDQVGIATKLVEIGALALVLRPLSERRLRAIGATMAVVALVVLTDIAAWTGAFAAGGDGHHAPGAVAAPGIVLPAMAPREPRAEEIAAADALHAATVAALARYADPAVAALDGYAVEGMAGSDFHASNASYESDGIVLDPERPETLVYASSPSGPVLLGAMFLMPDAGPPGPAVGGPLTVWHAHEHVCFTLTPPALTGLLSPLGGCGFAAIDLPLTAEMIHVWTVPGAPDRFGDLDEAWRAEYVRSIGG